MIVGEPGTLGELVVTEHTSPWGRRLIVQATDPKEGGVLDEREAEQLRDACQRFIDGEPV